MNQAVLTSWRSESSNFKLVTYCYGVNPPVHLHKSLLFKITKIFPICIYFQSVLIIILYREKIEDETFMVFGSEPCKYFKTHYVYLMANILWYSHSWVIVIVKLHVFSYFLYHVIFSYGYEINLKVNKYNFLCFSLLTPVVLMNALYADMVSPFIG